MNTTNCVLEMLYSGKEIYVSRFYLFRLDTKYLVNLQTFILEVIGSNFISATECLDYGYWQLSIAACIPHSLKES